MEKFIRIESTLINVSAIADIYPNVFNDCITIHTNDGATYIKQLPEHINTLDGINRIDDITSAYLDLIASFLSNKEPDELVLDLNAYDSAE